MVPFEYLVDSRHASKDAVYHTAGRLPHQFICGKTYVDPAVPIARPRNPNEPAAFNDMIPGASQRMGSTPVARETPRGLPPSGANHPMAPPITYANPAERERAATGVLAPPPWPV